jgi:predicted permease
MKNGAPLPLGLLAWLLRLASSRAAAHAAIGDMLEELSDRTAAGRRPRFPALWINLHTVRAIVLEMSAAIPRLLRTTGLIVRDALRALRAAPAHALFIVLVLAAGVTLGTVTFSVVDAVVLTPLPVEQPERLVSIPTRDEKFTQRITPDLYHELRARLTSVEALAARAMMTGMGVTVGRISDEWPVTQASAEIFSILRLSPAIGRFWTADDEARGQTDVAVLGYRFWRQQLGGDPSVLGKTVTVGTRAYSVIGVLSAESDHPAVDLTTTPLWVPIRLPRSSAQWFFSLIARTRPGVSPSHVADEVQRVTGVYDWRPNVAPLLDTYVAPVRSWMLLALGAAALVILVACANVANLMLARTAVRSQEMAIRGSLGASRRQIAISLLAEGLMLSVGATAVALLLSVLAVSLAKVAVATALPGTFRASTIAMNGRVLLAALACAVTTGIAFSLVPAWQTSRISVSSLLKDGDGPMSTGRRRWRSIFLTAEIATVVVLMVVSWLFVVSLIRVVNTDLGIDRENLLAVSPRVQFAAPVDDVQRRIERVPGVAAVAVSSGASLPLVGRAFGGAWTTRPLLRADGAPGGSALEVLDYRVTPNYFAAAGLRFRRGGTWQADGAGGPPVVVLDEQAARRLFGDEDPIGRPVRADAAPGRVRVDQPAGVYTVIGTVPHVYARGAEDTDLPSAYFPLKPNPARVFAGLFVKTSRPAWEVLPAITEVLQPVAPRQKQPYVFVADEAVSRITATRRFNGQLMALFGLVGTLIGAAGVYAVMASFVAQQTREIGVRVALGATPARIQRGVLTLAGRHLLAGLALGVPAAWWLSRGFEALLFRVTPADASVYVGVAALLIAVGFLAAWVPARRAARIDPILTLRR